MDKKIIDTYVMLLKKELVTAMGCTEPIALAYAGAKLRDVMGCIPERCKVYCSGNIVKNVMGVVIPNSEGERGIIPAVLLGMTGGDASHVLAVLDSVTPDDTARMRELIDKKICSCELVEGVSNLYIRLEAEAGESTALVEIKDYHSNITRIEKNGEIIFDAEEAVARGEAPDKSLLNVRDILDFADTVDVERIREPLENQISCNSAIAEEGLKGSWGAMVGKTIMEIDKTEFVDKAMAYAAAASDARMNGCSLPVVINSGSGNQGITVSMPVYVYARDYNIPHEKLLRALAAANLISLHQKRFIGSLSAYCGAVSAATAAACGIAYMQNATYEQICGTIINSITTDGGMVCDGAKSSCAAKIASAVSTALIAKEMSMHGRVFQPGEGLVKPDVESTIASVGRMGREGMRSTDVEILKIMLGQ